MSDDTLEDDLRRRTRNRTQRLGEEDVISLGCDLLRELQRAHREQPPRFPGIEPSRIPMVEGRPRLDGAGGSLEDDLFDLGALLNALAQGTMPEVAWRLDGPPRAPLPLLARRAALWLLSRPGRGEGYGSADEALRGLEAARSPAAAAASPWPLFRGSPGRTGASASEAGAAPAADWQKHFEIAAGPVVASPVLVGSLVVAATANGRLLFVDRERGRVLEEMKAGSAVESSPAVADGRLFVGSDDGELLAVDLATGREAWRVTLGRMVRSSPLVAGDQVLVGVVGAAKGAGALVAVARDSGKVRWSRAMGAVFSSPALDGDTVVVGSDDGALYGLGAAKGDVRWRHALGGKVRATPAVHGGVAVAGDFEGRLAAVRVSDGTRVWTRELGHPMYSSPCLSAGLCVVGCHDGHVHGVDLGTGEPRFEARARGPVVASPSATPDGAFVVGSTDGTFHAIDATGAFRRQVLLAREGIQSSAAVAGREVFLGSARGLHALTLTP